MRWRVGAFDLYRPGEPGLIVDFKTQDVAAAEAESLAAEYSPQSWLYRAATEHLGCMSTVRFHFTKAGITVRAERCYGTGDQMAGLRAYECQIADMVCHRWQLSPAGQSKSASLRWAVVRLRIIRGMSSARKRTWSMASPWSSSRRTFAMVMATNSE